jgi:hypothetical protein
MIATLREFGNGAARNGCPPDPRALDLSFEPELLEDLSLPLAEAFASLPAGGDVGGILLGRQVAGRLYVTDFLPFFRQYCAPGPYTFSETDHRYFSDMLAAARLDPTSRPVGWYRSQLRGEMALSADDIELHDRYFPEPWQVMLLVKLDGMLPAHARFLVRTPGGMDIHSSFEFELAEAETLAPIPVSQPEDRSETDRHRASAALQEENASLAAALEVQTQVRIRAEKELADLRQQFTEVEALRARFLEENGRLRAEISSLAKARDAAGALLAEQTERNLRLERDLAARTRDKQELQAALVREKDRHARSARDLHDFRDAWLHTLRLQRQHA